VAKSGMFVMIQLHADMLVWIVLGALGLASTIPTL